MPDHESHVSPAAEPDDDSHSVGAGSTLHDGHDPPADPSHPVDSEDDETAESRACADEAGYCGGQTKKLLNRKNRWRNCYYSILVGKLTLEAQCKQLSDQNVRLRRQIQGLTTKRARQHRSWPSLLHTGCGISALYTMSCLEENMSPRLDNLHPGLTLTRITNRQLQEGLAAIMEPDRGGRGEEDEAAVVGEAPVSALLSFFRGDALPDAAVIGILEHALYYNSLVHAISRLDPTVEPDSPEFEPRADDVPGQDSVSSGLPKRLHVGERRCNVTRAIRPAEHLAPLRVCRRWHFFGAHLFYGCNTFAFSSLGEFGRFTNGIGPAVQRIQAASLLWVGSQYLTQKHHSRRTLPLLNLCDMRRLRFLDVYVSETSHDCRRRRRVGDGYADYLAAHTNLQPNHSKNRSLRSLQGLDYVHQLRGMRYVRFWDFQASREHGVAEPVRDWSFVADVNLQTSQKKGEEARERGRVGQLDPLMEYDGDEGGRWSPGPEAFDAAKKILKAFRSLKMRESGVHGEHGEHDRQVPIRAAIEVDENNHININRSVNMGATSPIYISSDNDDEDHGDFDGDDYGDFDGGDHDNDGDDDYGGGGGRNSSVGTDPVVIELSDDDDDEDYGVRDGSVDTARLSTLSDFSDAGSISAASSTTSGTDVSSISDSSDLDVDSGSDCSSVEPSSPSITSRRDSTSLPSVSSASPPSSEAGPDLDSDSDLDLDLDLDPDLDLELDMDQDLDLELDMDQDSDLDMGMYVDLDSDSDLGSDVDSDLASAPVAIAAEVVTPSPAADPGLFVRGSRSPWHRRDESLVLGDNQAKPMIGLLRLSSASRTPDKRPLDDEERQGAAKRIRGG